MATVTKIPERGQPQAGTVHWLNVCSERGKNEVFSETITVTPGLAGELLRRNENNRPISEARVRQYARDMIGGKCVFNGEPIIISVSGELNDGQHRLQAIIASNKPQAMLIVFGVERDTRVTVDQGGARTAGHYLGMDGIKNANLCASIARLVIGYEESGGTKTRSDATNAEVVSRVRRDAAIGVAAQYAGSVQKYARGLVTGTFIGAAYYIFAEIDEASAKEFLDQVCIGENIKRGQPAFAVRQALARHEGVGNHKERRNVMEALFRGWNAHRQGRKQDFTKSLGVLPALV